MDVTSIPFHAHLGLELAKPPHLLQLSPRDVHQNHLGTIHASVMIAVAEAGSGLFLKQHLEQDVAQLGGKILPIIRRIDAKFHQAGQGLIYCRCTMEPDALRDVLQQLKMRNRVKVVVPMQVVDTKSTLLLSASFDWFIQRDEHASAS